MTQPPPAYVRVAVYEPDAQTIIATIPRRRNVQWLNEVNTPGTGQFEFPLDDPLLVEHPDLLDEFNVVKLYVDDTPVKAWIIESVQPVQASQGEGADRWYTVSGRGPAAGLEAAIVYPEYGLRELTSEDRFFNFSSADGPWRNPADWQTPVGVKWGNAVGVAGGLTGNARLPGSWPDASAYWLWSSNPDSNVPPGVNWFRATFTLDQMTPVVISASADNQLTGVYIDGELILSSGQSANAYQKVYQWSTTLAHGDHTIAAAVTNLAGTPKNNPAGFICTISRADIYGRATGNNIMRSTPSTFTVKAYGTTPGWNGATILQELVTEAQDRGVTVLQPITFNFDNVHDSNGVAWNDIQNRSVKVGTTDLWDIATQVIELSLDMDIDANFVMHTWARRGSDLSDTVSIVPARDVTALTSQVQSSRVRNQTLVKYTGGWMEVFAPGSKDTWGRREVGLSLGTSEDGIQTILAAQAAIEEVAQPETTITVTSTSFRGPQPFVDFDLGDTITIPTAITTPGAFTTLTKGRVMSIAGSELGESGLQWDIDFYPAVDDESITAIVVGTGQSYNDPSSLYRAEVLSDSPWGYWRLKETSGTSLSDSSGRNYDMTLYYPSGGAPTYSVPGPVDQAMTFNTASGVTAGRYAETFAATTLVSSKKLFNYKNATVELWVNFASRPGTGKTVTLLAFDQIFGNAQFGLLATDDGHVRWRFTDGSATNHTLNTSMVLALGAWYHIVGSVGAKGQKLYVNGVLNQQDSSIPNVKLSEQGYEATLRASAYGSDRCNVSIAEPAVYGQQLLNSRITSHFYASGYTP